MNITPRGVRTRLKNIQGLRALFLQETNVQVRYNAVHERGWSDSYLLTVDDREVGYGSVMGGEERSVRDTVFEFFVIPPFRNRSSDLFRELLIASGAGFIECQSNDRLLSSALFEFGENIRTDTVLFADHAVTRLAVPGAVVRERRRGDTVFEHTVEPVGDLVVDVGGDVVATGGFLLHYNMPFADLFMEVREDRRRQGFGSLLLQEVKRECYLSGRVPAARCGLDNRASRATLERAGLRVCGFMLRGTVRAVTKTSSTAGPANPPAAPSNSG